MGNGLDLGICQRGLRIYFGGGTDRKFNRQRVGNVEWTVSILEFAGAAFGFASGAALTGNSID